MYDKSFTPWKVIKLHAIFDVWSKDDLLKTSPCYFVSSRLAKALDEGNLSGFTIGNEIEIQKSESFINMYPEKNLDEYYLLEIIGDANTDDFGISFPNKLVVSEKAMALLKMFSLADAKIIEL